MMYEVNWCGIYLPIWLVCLILGGLLSVVWGKLIQKLSNTRVMAEKAGMVTNLDLPPGNYIKIGEPLFTMVTDDSWRAIAYFKETVLHKIRTGQKAKIELVAYPGHVFHGVVWGGA